jgi:trafficking protein particle complex subunit 13
LSQSSASLPTAFDSSFGSDFILSSNLLLPDSFGDIYVGEKFTAYIAIVNGFPQVPFYSLSVSVSLQTQTTTIDLQDIHPTNQIINPNTKSSTFALLNFNESCDVMIQHVLSELGTHTMRVSVQYAVINGGEIKSMRKFYRFNVLLPLIVLSSFREVLHKPMVQCQITNATKSPIFIEEVSFFF